MRRKNRQVKITLDIPEEFKDDEDFADGLAALLDEVKWNIPVVEEENLFAKVSKIEVGNAVITE